MEVATKLAAMAKRTLPVSGVFDEVGGCGGRARALVVPHGATPQASSPAPATRLCWTGCQ